MIRESIEEEKLLNGDGISEDDEKVIELKASLKMKMAERNAHKVSELLE